MGKCMSRRNVGVEEVDISIHNAYKYPPKSGCYFGSHFIMGGERFDTIQPEAYLFGENQDLNFLGSRPIPFPYPAPQSNEPIKTLRSLVNIRKDSLRFIRIQENENNADRDIGENNEKESSTKYNIEFTFDTDVRCAITIYYFAMEEFTNGKMVYHPRDASMNSETFHYKRGANQTFSQTAHVIDPSKFSEEDWLYNPEKETIPVVIQCVAEEEDCIGHAHITFGFVEKNSEDAFNLKPLKQKQTIDGLCFLLQEIYGIENKNAERKISQDDEFEDNGSECVICMSDTRDTLILPCRHLCLCNGCANNLRYQANNCPICRAPFRALLQIRALRKKVPNSVLQHSDDVTPVSQEGVPSGYEAVALIEALNGPSHPAPLPNPLQIPPEGLPPPTRPSVLNSPTESPILDKQRKGIRRQTSVGSRSLRDAAVPEEIEEVRNPPDALTHEEVVEQGRGTPEVVMYALAPEPVKPDEKGSAVRKGPLSKIRMPGGKKPSSPDGLEDPLQAEDSDVDLDARPPRVEIINETGKLNRENLLYSNMRQVTQETNVTDSDSDSDSECEMVEASAETPEPCLPISSHVSSDVYLDEDDDEEDVNGNDEDDEDDEDDAFVEGDAKPSIVFCPAAHTKVLYEREDDITIDKYDDDSLAGIPHDTISLPGTPLGTDGSSGSSYGSTSSTRMLLPPVMKIDEDKVQIYKPEV